MQNLMTDYYLFPEQIHRLHAALQPHHIHFWLHSCGDNTPLLPALIEGGVTVMRIKK